MAIDQNEQAKQRELPSPERPKYVFFFQNRTDRIMGINQTEQSKIWVFTRQNRAKQWYSADRTDQGKSFAQREQTEIWALTKAKYDCTDKTIETGI